MAEIIRILFFAFLMRPILSLFIGLRVYGRRNIPRKHSFIIVANHASHLDAVALLSLFHMRDLALIRPVAAADYFNRNRLVGFVSSVFFNILPIERKHICRGSNPLDDLRTTLSKGQSLIIFPEGTRSMTGEIGTFHAGVAHLAKEFPQIPVIPVYMSNMWRALPKGEFILLPFICELHIGPAIFPKGSKEEMIQAVRGAVLELKGASR